MTNTSDDARRVLAQMIIHSLETADAMGLTTVGISLNEALVRLTGEGVAPAR